MQTIHVKDLFPVLFGEEAAAAGLTVHAAILAFAAERAAGAGEERLQSPLGHVTLRRDWRSWARGR